MDSDILEDWQKHCAQNHEPHDHTHELVVKLLEAQREQDKKKLLAAVANMRFADDERWGARFPDENVGCCGAEEADGYNRALHDLSKLINQIYD